MSDYGVGNNENEAALVQNWYGTDVDFAKYKRDYLKLYKETIEKIVQQEYEKGNHQMMLEINAFCMSTGLVKGEGGATGESGGASVSTTS